MNLFEFPFGTYIAQSYFAIMINDSLKELTFCFIYPDDIILFLNSETQHLDHLYQVFGHFCEAKMKLKLAKCSFVKHHYLGQLLSHEVVSLLPEKPDRLRSMLPPQDVKNIGSS